MRPELRHAYPRLKREWTEYGKVRRMDGVRGVPDFLLTCHARPRIAIFTEVKAIESLSAPVKLDMNQSVRLQDLLQCGLLARVLVCISESSWAVCDGPFLDAKLNQLNLRIDNTWRGGAVLTPAFLLGFTD